MKFSLIENANSFLSEALERALRAEQESQNWKFAILSLVQSIELLLKERLRREHACLIYSDIDNQKHTISIEKAANRLQKVAGVVLKESDIKNIRTAATIRNSIVHHEFELNTQQVKAVFAKLLGFLSEFYDEQLEINIANILPQKSWDEAIKIDKYLEELYVKAIDRIKRDNVDTKFVMSCPKCWQDTFIWAQGIDHCCLCNYAEEVSICQECGLILFKHELHTAYYGKWMSGDKKEYHDWYPNLCDSCFENYVFDEETDSVEFIHKEIPDYP